MSSEHAAEHWEQRYREGDLPWDARQPEPRLTELAATLERPAPLALDLGCGAGDNTFWLAQDGQPALGIDVAPTAIAIAQARAKERHETSARFVCASVLDPLPVRPAGAGLALDRGCFHVLDESDRPRLARRVAEALVAGGWWLILCGNVDEPRPEGEQGPPQLTARQVIDPVEPWFEVHSLERTRFSGSDARPTHLAWRALLCRRG